MSLHACIGCGGLFERTEGPVHDYMESSPACWASFGEVLAREYADPSLMRVHRLSVDAYAVQHPGGTSRQAIQSVGLHLVRLCLILERGWSAENANAAMLRASRHKASMFRLPRPSTLGGITVADVVAAADAAGHRAAVLLWADSAWQAWKACHPIVRGWADAA
jgi:hypothetical protein